MNSGGEGTPDDREMAAVSDVIDELVDSWNRHDMRTLAGLCTGDADFVDAFGNWFKGRDEIEKILAARHATVFRESRFATKDRAVRIVSRDVAIVHTVMELTGAVDPAGVPLPAGLGVLMYVMATDERGAWRILAFQNTSASPVPGVDRPRPQSE